MKPVCSFRMQLILSVFAFGWYYLHAQPLLMQAPLCYEVLNDSSKPRILLNQRGCIEFEKLRKELGASAIRAVGEKCSFEFLDKFKLAYETKNILYLEEFYMQTNFIIAGTMIENSSHSADKVRLAEFTRQEYINGIRKVFEKNTLVHVLFDSINIVQHEKIPQVFGVSCKQQWSTSSYSDEGYLFLMLDLCNPDKPKVMVRCWQPSPFEDGSIIRLNDFDVVEVSK